MKSNLKFDSSILLGKLGLQNNSCSKKCSFLWDGFGRWVNNQWKPYIERKSYKPFISLPPTVHMDSRDEDLTLAAA